MYPILFSCSYFTIYTFGFCLFVAYFFYLFLLERDDVLKRYLDKNQLQSILFWGLIVAVLGGRLLYGLSCPEDFQQLGDIFNVFDERGGFSMLGALGALCFYAFFIYKRYKFPFALVVDRFALYAPFLHAFGRIGCFFAGCCYGVQTRGFLSTFIVYHPTQLYSAVSFFLIGIILLYARKNLEKIKGRVACCYLVCISSERLFVDFLRADRVMLSDYAFFSFDQLCATIIIVIAATVLFFLHGNSSYEHKRS